MFLFEIMNLKRASNIGSKKRLSGEWLTSLVNASQFSSMCFSPAVADFRRVVT